MFLALHAHPLFYGVLGAFIGIIFSVYITTIVLGIIIIIGSITLWKYCAHHTFIFIFLGIVMGSGRCYLTMYCAYKAQQEIFDITHDSPASCSGTVIDYGYKDGIYHRHNMTLRLETLNNQPVFWAHLYTVVLNAPGSFKCKINDRVACTNIKLQCPQQTLQTNWLFKSGAIARVYQNSYAINLIYRPFISMQRFIFDQRASLWLRIKRSMPLTTYTLMASLFGGSKEVNKEQNQRNKLVFKRWGIAHQLARSGMHVSFFIGLWMILLQYMPLGLVLRSCLIIMLIMLYSMLSWPSVSFNRALIMAVIDQFLRITGKQKNSLHVWSLTTALVILYNPFYIFFIDFQLSFGFSLLLIWMAQLTYLEKRGI